MHHTDASDSRLLTCFEKGAFKGEIQGQRRVISCTMLEVIASSQVSLVSGWSPQYLKRNLHGYHCRKHPVPMHLKEQWFIKALACESWEILGQQVLWKKSQEFNIFVGYQGN